MKKLILAASALFLAGSASALTANKVVKASSQTYITDSQIQDNGTGVSIATTPVSGSTLAVNGVIHSLINGFKFPDGTTQTTAAIPLAIGNAVSGGGANRVLYEDGSQNLAANSGFTFNGTTASVSAVQVSTVVFADSSIQFTASNGFTTYAAAVSSSVTNTASETSIMPTGGGSTLTIPANRLRVGTAVRISVYGDYTTNGTPPTSATFKIKVGSTYFHTFAVSHPPASQTGAPWKVDATYVVRSTGGSGTISGAAFLTMQNAAVASPYVSNATMGGATNTGASVIDTTTANTVDMTVTWSSAVASNTIRAAAVTVEILN